MRLRLTRTAGYCAALILAMAFAGEAMAQSRAGADAFQTGVVEYRAGRFEQALSAFLRADQEGYQSPNLDLNLGLTYYRLRRYEHARVHFERLREAPGFAAIAEYHLGLVAARQHRRDAARLHFETAMRTAPNPKLKQLARTALQRMDGAPAASRTFYYALVGAGYDGNPALLSQDIDPLNGADDSGYAELVGLAQWPLAGFALNAGVHARKYFSVDGLDQSGAQIGLQRMLGGDGRYGRAALQAETIRVDGRRLLNIVSGEWQGSSARAGAGPRLWLRVSGLDASDAFAHLDGWRLRAGADWRRTMGGATVRSGYEFEFNDRRDLRVGEEFFSHSPMRHQVYVRARQGAGQRLSVDWRGRVRHSIYRDANRFMTDDGVFSEKRRTESLLSAGAVARLRGGEHWSWLLEYRFDRNRANLDVFDYSRHLTLLGVEWLR
jgi:hypothetical protein